MENNMILMIETSTGCCSVALSRGNEIIAERVTTTPRQHASILAPFVQEVLSEAGVTMSECNAVSVSEGPGSYTGLRVGVSTAKGLCFGAGKPLVSVNTLQVLAIQGAGKADIIIPMIDARRMEVYTAVFDSNGSQLSDVEAKILDENSFSDLLETHKVLFIGDCVEKFQSVCKSPNASFEKCWPLASAMLKPSLEAVTKKRVQRRCVL
jgi:universal bacterial protein YeaZ